MAVAKLRAQGAILIGKTTTPEFGSKCLTDSPLFGRTRNAWSAERSCGGSSGGAAVAVASGIAPLAIATDGGGSTRIPAACNGVVGLKQSNGVIAHSQALDAFGNQTYVTPTTRTVADTALMMQAMAGEDCLRSLVDRRARARFHRHRRAARRSARAEDPVLRCRRPAARCRPMSPQPSRRASIGWPAWVPSSKNSPARGLTSSRSGVPSTTPSGARVSPSWWPSTAMSSARPSSSRSRSQPMSAASTIRRRCSTRTALFRRVQSLLARGHLAGDADHHPHRAADRPGPVRHHRDRRPAASTASGRTGSPGPCRST